MFLSGIKCGRRKLSPTAFICTYLQQPPPKPKFGPPLAPPLQQQRRRSNGSRHPQPQILSIMPFKQPFLQMQSMRMIISIQRQQLSPSPRQFIIFLISSCKIVAYTRYQYYYTYKGKKVLLFYFLISFVPSNFCIPIQTFITSLCGNSLVKAL